MQITYFHHSGVLVETENTVLVFDYYTEHGRHADYFSPQMYPNKDIVVFVSHAHGDHFDSEIFKWDSVSYVLDSGAKASKDCAGEVLYVEPNKKYRFHGMDILTLKSNDEGVAFLVKADGKTIYHAGDLNWWHWNGEPQAFLDDIKASYQTEIGHIAGEKIDVAFVPADLRLADKYHWAVDYFLAQTDTTALFPIHFWGEFEVCDRLIEQYGDKIKRISHANQKFEL